MSAQKNLLDLILSFQLSYVPKIEDLIIEIEKELQNSKNTEDKALFSKDLSRAFKSIMFKHLVNFLI